ncbi:MAG: hypothetical protein A3B29_00115, partial [Candidatus Sungbacteria bacterium RIFCSPLOWO2_01_FULL_51_34]
GLKWAFVAYVAFTNTASYLQPGTYVFREDASLPAIVSMLTQSGRKEITITIPEGWSVADIVQYLKEKSVASAEDLRALAERKDRPAAVERFLFVQELPENATLEGYLFPDTYRVFGDATAEDVIVKMLENFEKKLSPDVTSAVEMSGRSLHENIIVASLIEKEVATDEDRVLVSGILWKRFKNGMPLQVDATINYITGNRTTTVSIADTTIESAYNTYKYEGLPTGPIANPGLEAIRAALHPKASGYFFYLSAPDGRTIFSKTLDEHNIAKAKYLRN